MEPIYELTMTTDVRNDTMTIREMCETFEVTPRTLRFYEAKELLTPVRIGTKRLFTRRDRARLALILRGKRFGFSLEDIRQTLDLYDRDGGNSAQRQRAYELAVERLAEMEAQRAELDLAIAELKAELADAEAKGLVPRRAA
jgi:DNA-binding transcriptional MerR regulator